MSKNLSSTLLFLLTIGCMALIILNKEHNTFDSPMVLDENVIWIDFKDNSQMDIWMRNSEDVFGVQFEFDGIKILSTSGGVFEREGFNTANNERLILSFSYEGKSIEPGEYLLTTVEASFLNAKENVKMKNMVLAGGNGNSLDFIYYDSIYKTTTLRSN